MQARKSKVRPTGQGGFKGIWRGGEKRKTQSPAAEGSSGCYSVPCTDTHTLAASQGPTYVLRGRHWQARSLIFRDSARSVLDSAQQGRRSTQRVNPGRCQPITRRPGSALQLEALPLPPPLPRGGGGGQEPAGTSC